MLHVEIEMDVLANVVLTYPDEAKERLADIVDNDRLEIIKQLRMIPGSGTSMVIKSVLNDQGERIMGRTLVEPNYADAGCFLESAVMNTTPKDLYTALHSLCMDEEYILGTLPYLARKILP